MVDTLLRLELHLQRAMFSRLTEAARLVTIFLDVLLLGLKSNAIQSQDLIFYTFVHVGWGKISKYKLCFIGTTSHASATISPIQHDAA